MFFDRRGARCNCLSQNRVDIAGASTGRQCQASTVGFVILFPIFRTIFPVVRFFFFLSMVFFLCFNTVTRTLRAAYKYADVRVGSGGFASYSNSHVRSSFFNWCTTTGSRGSSARTYAKRARARERRGESVHTELTQNEMEKIRSCMPGGREGGSAGSSASRFSMDPILVSVVSRAAPTGP